MLMAFEASNVEQNEKKIYSFFRQIPNILSRAVKLSAFSLVLRTRENTDFFTALDEIYLVFTSKQ